MKIAVINGSPAGPDSITLQTILYIQKYFPEHEFSVLHAGQRIRGMENDFTECAQVLNNADLVIFAYPVYTFLAPAQLHRFIELIRENNIGLSDKYVTQVTTSKHFYDVTAHRYIRDVCADMHMKYLDGLSADMDDLLHEKGQQEALSFFRFILWNMKNGYSENIKQQEKKDESLLKTADEDCEITEKKSGKIAVVADCKEDDVRLKAMISAFEKKAHREVNVINLQDFPFAGGCLGCFRCAADGRCVYKDGFDTFLREKIQTSDAVVYAFRIQGHSMGYRFKLFDDRQFCNGHRTVMMGKPFGYLVDGFLSEEENLRTLIHARAQVGGNYLAGIVCSEDDPDEEIGQLADTLEYALANTYQMPADFYGVGGMKIFRDLIWQMQGMMKEDHRFYKEHGFYDFPQKKKGTILAMYLVGAMMNNEKIRKKMNGKMTEGMLMPYQSVLKKADRKLKRAKKKHE